jgi:hypothetical protein
MMNCKDLEGRYRDLIKFLPIYFLEGTEESHDILKELRKN